MNFPFLSTQDNQQLDKLIKSGIFLVVDDFDSMRKATISQLRQLGVTKIFEAANGAEAVKVLEQQPITVILSDWNMPIMTGMDLLLTVRSSPDLFRIPFMMITSEADRARVTQAIQVGVSSLLVKPYTAGSLADRLGKLVQWKPRHNEPIDAEAVANALGIAAKVAQTTRGGVPAKKIELLKLDTVKQQVQLTVASPNVSATQPQPQEKSTILVVDDTPDNLTLLAHLFKDDYKVKIAHRGDKAVTICQSDSPPDLVLLDIMMPEMDGFEVAKLLRGHPASEHIPIIFVTALTDDASKQKGLELGAVDFVTKPIDPNGLKIRVKNFMRYIELHRALQGDYDNLMQMEQLKSDVEQITRHDMKAPLSGVIGLAQDLFNATNLTSDQREQIHMIEETAMQLLNMFNLSNEIFKIEAGRFQLNRQTVDVMQILRRTVLLMDKTFSIKGLRINLQTQSDLPDSQFVGAGDPMLCYSVFLNLLKNACEAAPDNSVISLLVSKKDAILIRISNSGVVPAQIRESFFEKFATAGKPLGTGLGTYSAKLLVEAQHGSIDMKTSDEDNKTSITVSLPIQK
ncbi:MAG: hypothetical protein RIR18_1890 [Pseudomonadota bacterium]|jgi:PleD family two-component response regulator